MVMIGGSELLREYRIHVLEVPSDFEDQDGSSLALALIVLRRSEGLLIAVPDGVFSQEALAGGLDVTQDDQPLGQSIVVTVPGGTLPGFEGTEHPDPLEDAQVDVLLVDVSNAVAAGLTPFDARAHPMELLHTFNANIPQLVPVADHLVSAVWNWIQDPGSGQLVQFYSAEEEEAVPETPLGPARRTMRPKASPGVGGGGARPNGPAESKKPRPTVASLAASLDTVTQTLPMIVQQLEALALRTENVERHVGKDQSRPSALQEPLGSCATTGLLTASRTPAEMLKLMPPPKGTRTGAGAHPPAEVEQLAKEKLSEEDNPQVDLAKAVYAQSQALTSLVAQLAAGDPMTDLSSSSTSLSTKGAQGRAKLQQELAQHRGTFFTSVLQSMSRRMQPAQPSDLTPQELGARGIIPTTYVERFGGYGRQRDLGCLQWQVAMILDHLQNENYNAAKDATALLAVCIEQSALDNGRLDIGLLLALADDPPSGVFQTRSTTNFSRGRAFAPLADQRWVTTALAFIKEMDLINSKRLDVTTKGKDQSKDQDTEPAPKKATTKKTKGGGKAKGSQSPGEDT